jgi:hypothetical protein
MIKIKRPPVIPAAVLFFTLLANGYAGTEAFPFLKERVHDLSGAVSLDNGLQQAQRLFHESGEGELYFVGYEMISRHQVHLGLCDEFDQSYQIEAKGNEIKVSKQSGDPSGFSQSTDADKPGAAGILLLCRTGKNPIIEDLFIIDLEQEYYFQHESIYWLGKRENDESFTFVTKTFFGGVAEDVKNNLLFAVSLHPGDRSCVFLKQTALSEETKEMRKNAGFWLGTHKDNKSLTMLQDIFKQAEDREIREHIIFAIQLNDSDRAVHELIRIAKKDNNSEMRKKAVFWLGQKVSEKSVQALKDVVDSQDEDIEVKESAVFAISRMPEEKSVPILIDIAKTSPYSGVRKKAIFWLGQKSIPKTLTFFEEVLLKK